MPMIIDGSQGLTFPDNSRQYMGFFGFKNRIINGDMRIDQRNNGAVVSIPSPGAPAYAVDRFFVSGSQTGRLTAQRNAGAVTPPPGFTDYFGVTSSSAYSVLASDAFYVRQQIEGFNTADFAFGTANAQAVTVSFWVRSSLTGSFGGNISNSAFSRSYPFSYTITAANTWEQKSVTIPGDTTGTWLTNNGTGLILSFGLGYGSSLSGTANAWNAGTAFMPTGSVSVVGTNGATFYITGVQLEEGITATNFDVRPYGTELSLCQRYFETFNVNAAGVQVTARYAVVKRAAPTITRLGNWNSSAEAGTVVSINEVAQVLLFNGGGAQTGGTFTAAAEL